MVDLLEPFLLPSLVGAILWMGAYTGEQPNSDLDVLLRMLERVTRAPSSGDAQTLHSTIIAMISQPLSNRLKTLRKRHPGRKDIDPILAIAKSHSDFCHGPYSACSELQTWRKSPGSLRTSVRATFQSLILWSGSSAINPTQPPPHYNPRQFLITEREIGAKAVLAILVDELKTQTEAPNGAAAVAIDIATAIICAPTTENSPIEVSWIHSPVPTNTPGHARRLNLRDALRIEFENATDLIEKNQLAAETIVRLHRRVESQLALSTASLPDLATSMPAMLPSLGMTANSTTVDAVSQVIDFTDASAGLDLTNVADSMALDSTLDSMNMLANQGISGDGGDNADDIFGDLDLGGMMDADGGMDIDMDGGWGDMS
jgi:mediator of RNA polymerase II transcription subunit 5